MRLVIAHISDAHVSRYGEHVTSIRGRRLRSELASRDTGWERVLLVEGWQVEQRVRPHWSGREEADGFELRLVDEAGYVQHKRKVARERLATAKDELVALVNRRKRTEHARLAEGFPEPAEIAELLSQDPTNTNLLFYRLARILREDAPDWVACTGDLTDDGIGYDLVLSWLAPFIDRRRFVAIPGNHDIYDSPTFFVPAHERKTRAQKRAMWANFARELDLPSTGPWLRELGAGVVMCGLDSCLPPLAPWSASGAILGKDLTTLGDQLDRSAAACRIGMIHHHVVNPPLKGVGRAPWQIGMRLRNADKVFDWFKTRRFRCVLNGHRHVGYRYQPAMAPLFVSAPSATLGCRSGAAPFYWRIEIDDGEVVSVRERPLDQQVR